MLPTREVRDKVLEKTHKSLYFVHSVSNKIYKDIKKYF